MAREIRHFTVSIAPGVQSINPQNTPITMPLRAVSRVDWRVPAGPLGLMGWHLSMDRTQLYPTDSDHWVIANGETGTWILDDAPQGGNWVLTGYNTGVHPHTVYLAFYCDPVVPPPARRRLISAVDLMPSPDLSQAGPPVRRAA